MRLMVPTLPAWQQSMMRFELERSRNKPRA
jgi:hypothetical protein